MSDRITVMNDGQIEQVGEVTDLYESPETRFVASFLGETNLFEGEITLADGRITLFDGDLEVTLNPDALEDDVVDGQDVAYTVRPESLHISDGELDTDNQWSGVVENAIYKGSMTLYEVDVGGRVLKVQRQRRKGGRPFEEDEEVVVGFDADEGELIVD